MNNLNIKEITINFFKINYKIIVGIILSLIILYSIVQYYIYSNSKKILETSLVYNEIFTLNNSSKQYEDELEKLSKDGSFFGTLATLEAIKIKLKNNNIDSAYNEYLELLDKNKLNNLYKSAIATQAAYHFLDKINIKQLKKDNLEFTSLVIYKRINNLLSFIDENIISYRGFKFEINFLLLVYELDYNNDPSSFKLIENIYQQIQKDDKITSSIKERVNKIYDYQRNQ